MKRFVLSSLMLFAMFFIGGQFAMAQAPSHVEKSFRKLFPHVKLIKWEIDDDGWEAEFHTSGGRGSAVFHENGRFLESEEEIKEKNLPAAVLKNLRKLFPKKRHFKDIEKITKHGRTYYKVEINDMDYKFDIQGRRLSY